jgi:hypothetical protein
LVGVSCATTSSCHAVGENDPVGPYLRLPNTFSEQWDGVGWRVRNSPNSPGAANGSLNAVSCRDATTCTGVGNYVNGSGHEMLVAESWNGASWSLQTTTDPADPLGSSFNAVSCVSSVCAAVGESLYAPSIHVTLAETWNGSSWALDALPAPDGTSAETLLGVSCATAKDCTAVGDFTSHGRQSTLVEHWDGFQWSLESTPVRRAPAALNAVSCTSASACTAVGFYTNGTGAQVTLAERWNGTAWSIQTTRNPAGASIAVLNSVSCIATGECTAGGSFDAGSGPATLAERWDGAAWSRQGVPSPPSGGALLGMSCAAANACTAAAGFPLAEAWSGVNWRVQKLQLPRGYANGGGSLPGVSCSAAAACSAVGGYQRGSSENGVRLPLIQRFS